MFTLARRWGNVTMKCSVSLALSSETCRTSFVVGRRLVGPRPTGYSPVAACLTLQTIISMRLVSCRSSNANHQNIHPVDYWRHDDCINMLLRLVIAKLMRMNICMQKTRTLHESYSADDQKQDIKAQKANEQTQGHVSWSRRLYKLQKLNAANSNQLKFPTR